MTNEKKATLKKIGLHCIFWLPVIFTFVYTLFCAVDILYADEWDLVMPLMEKHYDGSLSLNDIWRPHNEHRLVIVKALMFFVSLATRMNLLPIVVLMQFVFLFELLAVVGLMKRQFHFKFSALPFFALFVPYILYSWRLFDVFLYPSMIGLLLAVVGFIAALYFAQSVLAYAHESRKAVPLFICALLSAAIGAFSHTNGLFAWPLILCVFVVYTICNKEKRNRLVWYTATWALCFLALWGAYFYGLSLPSHGARSAEFFLKSAAFVTAYFGYALFPDRTLSIIAGAATISLSIFLFYRTVREKRMSENAPWFAVILFTALTSLALAWGRVMEFGIWQAGASRYALYSVITVIALIALLQSITADRLVRTLRVITFSVVAAGLLYSAIIGIPYGARFKNDRIQRVETLREYERRSDEDLQPLYWPSGARVREWARFLQEHRLHVFRAPEENGDAR